MLRGAWGWSLFGVVWGLALAGIVLKSVGKASHPIFSTGLYLLMGWLILFAFGPLLRAMPAAGVWWLAAGGLAYSFGVVFFAWKRLPFNHAIWHLFVLAGTACHAVAVLGYAA